MKKVFIGLLITVAAGAFFFLRKQNQAPSSGSTAQQLLVGTWKLDSLKFKDSNSGSGILALLDSNLMNYRYNFQKDSVLFISLEDSVATDSVHYLVNGENDLVMMQDTKGIFTDSLRINLINNDSLVALDKDSTALYFIRLKEK